MKASEIAKIILDESQVPGVDKLKVAAKQAHSLITAASTKTGTMQQFQSRIAVWREALTQWKAVVRAVQDEDMSHPIFANLFGAIIALVAPELFSILVQNNVFIGYQFTSKENEILLQQKLNNLFT